MCGPICIDDGSYDYTQMSCEPVPARSCTPTVAILTSDEVPNDTNSTKSAINSFVEAVSNDFIRTNSQSLGKASKFGAGLVVGGRVAGEFGAVTPLRWALSGFGSLPAEFTRSGAVQVFRYTSTQRLLLVCRAAVAKFIFVTVAWEGGVLIGSILNQSLSENARMMIGGTINEIVNEEGWKLLFTNPFGVGMSAGDGEVGSPAAGYERAQHRGL